MEWIDTEGRIGTLSIYCILDPLSTIAGYKVDSLALLRCEQLEKLLEDRLVVALSCPHFFGENQKVRFILGFSIPGEYSL